LAGIVTAALAAFVGAAAYPVDLAAQDLSTVVLADDGVPLATDVWLPAPFGRWPTILVRTPYGRDQHPNEADSVTALGFAFVAQDTRGRFGSGGEDTVFRDDGADGRATLRWVAAQP
jgi:putative CocE/NonD family hydrolase